MALVVDGDKQSNRLLKLKPKLLTSLAHRGGVHNGHQLLGILREQLEEQPLVPLKQVQAVDVLIDWILVTPQVSQRMVDSLVHGHHPGWEEAMDAQQLPLLQGEGEPLGAARLSQLLDS